MSKNCVVRCIINIFHCAMTRHARPGAYDIHEQKTTPSWTIRPRTGIKPDNYCTPGPAAYNNLPCSNAPKITIAPKTIPVETTTQQTPGYVNNIYCIITWHQYN